MKTFTSLLTVFAVVFISMTTIAQENETRYLIGSNSKVDFSGFGAFTTEFSSVYDNEFAVYTGGGGAVLLNQTFYIGGYGQGLSTVHTRSITRYEETLGRNQTYNNQRTTFGHGGFWLGYLHNSHNAVHWGVSSKFGWGSVGLVDKDVYHSTDNYNKFIYDNVFVVTPQLELELNLITWFKLNFAVGYRLVAGIDKTYKYNAGTTDNPVLETKQYFQDSDFNNAYGSVSLVFGWFN